MVVVVALGLGLAACAHGGAALTSPGGRLDLTNRTGEEVEVFIDGQRVAILGDGESRRIDRLPYGERDLLAVGKITATRLTNHLSLEADRVVAWRFGPTDAQAEALRNRPTGSLRVENHADEPVRVSVDGIERGMAWTGGALDVTGLALGRHTVRAQGTKTSFLVDADLDVQQNTIPVHEVRRPDGAIRLVNGTALATRIAVEGVTGRDLPAGAAVVAGNVPPGTYTGTATDRIGRPLGTVRLEVKAGEITEFRVPAPQGILAVISDLPVPVTLVADGRRLGECRSKGAAEFRGLVPGTARLQALNPSGAIVARARVSIPAEGQAVWLVKPGSGAETSGDEGALMVRNRAGEPVRIRVDGWDRGTIPPGGKRVVRGMIPGDHEAEAVGLRSGDVMGAVVRLSAGETGLWEAVAPSATLALKNTRDEEIRLLVDGAERVRLAPAQGMDLRLPSGRHTLLAAGVTTLKQTRHEVKLPAGTRTVLDLPIPTAIVVITNRHSEPLSVAAGDRDLGVVLPGDRVTVRDLEPGNFLLVARSLSRPLSWTQLVSLAPGQSFDWDLAQ